MSSEREDDVLQDGLDAGGLFNDPEGFYPPEKEPTFAEHQMLSGQTVRVRLVGSHPLYVRRE
jgi:nicotinamide N-methyltransferase